MKKFLKLIYSNKIFALLFVLFQLSCIVLAIIGFSKEYILVSFIAAILIIYEFNRDDNPTFKLTWILFIAITPIFGTFLYMFTHIEYIQRKLLAHSEELMKRNYNYLVSDLEILRELKKTDTVTWGFANYVKSASGLTAYKNTSVKYFPIGEDKWEEMKAQLKQAKKFIFMEYFIIEAYSVMWGEILDILKEKASDGVDIRIMYDGIGSLTYLPIGYNKTLMEYGIKCRVFSPVEPLFSTHQNNRDHRKILVIDGKTAFVGGINIADEYINKKERFGHWKDTAVMLKGDAVSGFTLMFMEMWDNYKHDPSDSENDIDDYNKYIVYAPEHNASGYILPIADTPLDKERIGKQAYIDLLYSAAEYVHITTPYLVIDNEMSEALKFAAKRGVDVKVILPHIPDKKYLFWLARTYYPDLLKAGVKIYEYIPGFIHAKMSVSDDIRAIVGSINHDFRSLYLHYECAVYMSYSDAVFDIEKDYSKTLEKCERITIEKYMKFNRFEKLLGKIIRIFAPLL